MKWIAVFALTLIVAMRFDAAAAQNCSAMWQGAFTGALTCEPYTPSTAADGASFYVEPGGTASDDLKKAVLDIAADAFVKAKVVYGQWGTLAPVAFIAVKDNHPGYNAQTAAIWGLAIVDKRRPGEACPVVLYPAMGDAADGQRVRQLVAHELWHCFQFDNMRGQLNGDPPPGVQQYWTDITMWWAEGSADYFSNLVFPSANLERNGQTSFDFKKQLHLQTGAGAYGASLFFQSMGNTNSPEAVVAFLKSLPTKGNQDAQRAALAAYGGLNADFHIFAKEIINNELMDSDGKPVAIDFTGDQRETALDEGTTRIAMDMKPFVIRPFVFKLEKGRLYTFPGLGKLAFDEHMKASYRFENAWYEANSDLKIDTRCEGMPVTDVMLLFTRTDDSAGGEAADQSPAEIDVKAEKSECPCDAMEAVPVCYAGNWLLDNNAIALAMADAQPKMTFGGLTGAIRAQIGAGGKLTLRLTDWTLLWKRAKDDDEDTMKSLKLVFSGEFDGKIGKAKSGRMCVIPTADRTTLFYEAMISYWGVSDEVGAALSNPMGDPMAANEVDLNCVGDEIFYSFPVKGTTYQGRLTREQ
jgi:hypothetical protein